MTSTTRRTGPDLRVIVGVFGILALVAIVAIYAVTSGDDTDTASTGAPEYGATDAVGTALARLPDTGPDPAVGQPAPELISERPDGATVVDTADLDEPVMLVFLAHWCPHCQRELPRLVELQDAGELSGVRTVAVLIATDPDLANYPPSAWLDREGWTGDRLYDDAAGTAALAYGVSSYPFLVLVDADGTVAQRLSGEQPAGAIEAALAALTS